VVAGVSKHGKRLSLWQDRAGAVAIYTAFAGSLLIGSAVLAVDYGRMAVLRTQMQNAADAAALAAAAQLDHQANARARAEDVARSAATQTASVGLGTVALEVADVAFFSAMTPAPVEATDDRDAAFVRVTLAPRTADLLFQPVLNLVARAVSPTTATLGARATAAAAPFVCNAPTVMICDLGTGDFGGELMSPAQAGRQLMLLEHGSAPANFFYAVFKLACPPGNPSCSAAQAAAFGASPDPDRCGGGEVSVVNGSSGDIDDSINGRFGDQPFGGPARNVAAYGRDLSALGTAPWLGDYGLGDWDLAGYWQTAHGGAPPPSLAGATRYQVYLHELGETFARSGSRTLYPVAQGAPLPPGYVLVPPQQGVGVPTNGLPAGASIATPARRVIRAGIANCGTADLDEPVPTNGQFMDLFVTERSADSVLYLEIIGPVTETNSSDFHNNVRLVE
jgi:Flp pilus assembly protein TadG